MIAPFDEDMNEYFKVVGSQFSTSNNETTLALATNGEISGVDLEYEGKTLIITISPEDTLKYPEPTVMKVTLPEKLPIKDRLINENELLIIFEGERNFRIKTNTSERNFDLEGEDNVIKWSFNASKK